MEAATGAAACAADDHTAAAHDAERPAAAPLPSVFGLTRDPPGPRGPGQALAELAESPAAPAAGNDPTALGLGGSLPPLAGGTSFGVEFACSQRTRWKSRSQFVLVLMGYCIGVGNLWRFPYLCGRYGGGAFLVAYLLMLFTCAGPLFFYETVLGQKFQRGPAETFRKMAPRWMGLAYVPVIMTLFYLPYYQLIVAYALHYFSISFQVPLPWVDGTTPDKFLEREVLRQTSHIGAEGSAELNMPLLVDVFLVYVITVLCLIKGIHSAGKAAYVTVILPVIMIVVLFFVCIRLDGASDGLKYYLIPRWEALLAPEVWGLAAGQIIFSLSPGTGTCISLASFHDPEYKGLFTDCVFVAVCNSSFSIFGGLVVFSVVGNLAKTEARPVEQVAASGEGLAFIVFAQGLAQAGDGVWPSVLAALFFLTLLLLGLDSTFAVVETLQTYVNDWIISRNPGEKISALGNALRLVVISAALMLVGLPYVTRAGYFLLEIADHFVVTYSLTVAVLLEYIMIGYAYGAEKLLEDVHNSTGRKLPQRLVTTQIRIVAPTILLSVLMLLMGTEVSGNDMAGYPGWAIFLFGVLPVLIAVSAPVAPAAQFHLRRLLWSKLYPLLAHWTPDGLAAARQRARGGGFKNFEDEERQDSTTPGPARA